MADEARNTVEIKDFPGMMNGVDAIDLPEGASESQLNVTCLRVGELSIRPGLKKVVFAEE